MTPGRTPEVRGGVKSFPSRPTNKLLMAPSVSSLRSLRKITSSKPSARARASSSL